jgi:hypothetical protein
MESEGRMCEGREMRRVDNLLSIENIKVMWWVV